MRTTSILIFIIALSTFSLSCKEKVADQESTITETKTETTDEEATGLDENGDPILTGKTEPSAIKQEPYTRWFTPTYSDYKVDTESLDPVMDELKNAKITVFMGTWCEDSQREVPSLFKILDKLDYDYSNLTLITMTEDKETPEGFEEGKNITNVPTIIINQNGKETNRIVEYPLESLEKDLVKILSGADYSHAYAEDEE
ncbi:thioredoxin family protein [Dokdonia sinensis]|uniref:Thioredoxin family protein n=1 Tax=Dokdonia sinensis TaxID=2479847 RepID=A0A3M0FUK8_9FLAO|nr:thioredoxin family protein [Dokdonia sinensis]RMB56341.1 thioredoxin family protein [Dokdonia sinensis]